MSGRRERRLRGGINALFASVLVFALGAPTSAKGVETRRAGATSRLADEPIFGSRVFVTEAGVGKAQSVVLIHGAGDDASRVWDDLVPVLAERYHVLTFDLPGFGRSSKPDGIYSPTTLAAFVKWAVDRYVKGRFVLVGHSLGGAVAIRYAAKYPERLDRLVLADVAGVLHRMALARGLLKTDLAGLGPVEVEAPLRYVDGFVKSVVARMPALAVDLGAVVESPFWREKLLDNDPGRVAALALAEEDLTQAIYSIRVPTLVLWGSKDETASLRTASVLTSCLTNANLRLFEGACHEPMREQPVLFRQVLLEWLSAGTPKTGASKKTRSDVGRVGRCIGAEGVLFTGEFRKIEVEECRGVTIADATVKEVSIVSSTVVIRDSRIGGGEVGLTARDSTIEGSGVSIEGKTAIEISGSRLDLAGVQLTGSRAAVTTRDHGKILFSIGRVRSPHSQGFLHGPWEITPEAPL